MPLNRFALIGFLSSLMLSACGTDEHRQGATAGGGMNEHTGGDMGDVQTPVASYAIDTDMAMDQINPGQEAGAFVEYEAGGQWHLYVTCDANVRGGRACLWDILTTPLGDWSAPVAEGLEADDQFSYDTDGPWVFVQTTTDYDGIRFTASPGAAVRFDFMLDGEAAHGYVRWVEGGAVNMGASTNPVELRPSVP